jgi:DNA-directed RNA polymerase specialized sigma24 family protein
MIESIVMANDAFLSFITRIREGDEDAARELVERFEGVIRREVRLRLNDRALLRVFDSMDISQSVLVSFFARASSGEFEIESPHQLMRLLIGMTRNKLAFQVRRQHARRRDSRLSVATRVDELEVESALPNPGEAACDRDLVDTIRSRLGTEERQLADLRGDGWEWSDIARQLGGSVQARRMQLARAIQRVAKSLHLNADADA